MVSVLLCHRGHFYTLSNDCKRPKYQNRYFVSPPSGEYTFFRNHVPCKDKFTHTIKDTSSHQTQSNYPSIELPQKPSPSSRPANREPLTATEKACDFHAAKSPSPSSRSASREPLSATEKACDFHTAKSPARHPGPRAGNHSPPPRKSVISMQPKAPACHPGQRAGNHSPPPRKSVISIQPKAQPVIPANEPGTTHRHRESL